ncbi:hypothetical protein LTR47_011591 [Exophiala xenobiotica]|nr:hypothetical protein LTR41_010627 [Exophiala xenobiotica]KAK5219274.1 hypothetical protein LTR47_011591 [Exophiala xenobiotica]KAK5251322.1 hypothetical protein LTS06_004079 [Exophiala xenobiotica]KAK5259620.1 hypothetical protein LTR40_005624 [Exophiala xenobiotica]KAK5350808.1 hypothetical protein LTR61_006006 [Exophiala xenobiotica]
MLLDVMTGFDTRELAQFPDDDLSNDHDAAPTTPEFPSRKKIVEIDLVLIVCPYMREDRVFRDVILKVPGQAELA